MASIAAQCRVTCLASAAGDEHEIPASNRTPGLAAATRPPRLGGGCAAAVWRPLGHAGATIAEFRLTGFPPHLRSAGEVIMPVAVCQTRDCRGRRVLAVAGAMTRIPASAGAPDAASVAGGWSSRVLLVAPTALGAAELRAHFAPSRSRFHIADDHLSAEFYALFRRLQWSNPQPGGEETLGRFVAQVDAQPGVRVGPRPEPTRVPSVRRARAYLVERVTERHTLDEIAAVAGLSKFYVLRAFAQRYGMTPRDYQMHLRLGGALAMMAAGASPSQVTHDAGYADQSHLTRHLRKSVGLTPAAYVRGWGVRAA